MITKKEFRKLVFKNVLLPAALIFFASQVITNTLVDKNIISFTLGSALKNIFACVIGASYGVKYYQQILTFVIEKYGLTMDEIADAISNFLKSLDQDNHKI